MVWACCLDGMSMLFRRYEHVVEMVWACCWDGMSMLLRRYEHVVEMVWACCWDGMSILLRWYEHVVETVWACCWDGMSILLRWYEHVVETVWACCWDGMSILLRQYSFQCCFCLCDGMEKQCNHEQELCGRYLMLLRACSRRANLDFFLWAGVMLEASDAVVSMQQASQPRLLPLSRSYVGGIWCCSEHAAGELT